MRETIGEVVGAAAGTTAGVSTSVVAVSALGIPGLSGAGIVTDLTVIGGSILGGVVVITAATAALSFGGIKLGRWIASKWDDWF